jgi:hypothetical protein
MKQGAVANISLLKAEIFIFQDLTLISAMEQCDRSNPYLNLEH